MSAAIKLQQQEATFLSILREKNPNQLRYANFDELLDKNATKFARLRELKNEYNASFQGAKGELNGNDTIFLRCLIEMLVNDMNLIREAAPDTYLSYLSDEIDSIPVRITRPSMAAMMNNDTNIKPRTVYDIMERVLAAGDRFISRKKNPSKIRKVIVDPTTGIKTLIYETARNKQGQPVIGRGEIVLYVSKKWLKLAVYKPNLQNFSNTDNQLVTTPKNRNLPQPKEDSNNTNNIPIKNHHPLGSGILEGVSTKQLLKKTSANAAEDLKSRNKPSKMQLAAKGAAAAQGGTRQGSAVRVLSKEEYSNESQRTDQIVEDSQPVTKTDKYARYLYLTINNLLFPENTDWYVQVAEEECIEKIKAIMRSNPHNLEKTYLFLTKAIEKAKNFQENNPKWEFQNIKKWLEMDNPYGFYQCIVVKWMPEFIKDTRVDLMMSKAKKKSHKCRQAVSRCAQEVLEVHTHSHTAAEQAYISKGRYLLGYFKKHQISEKVAKSCWNNYVLLTKSVLIKLKMMSVYQKSETWKSFLKDVELANMMML